MALGLLDHVVNADDGLAPLVVNGDDHGLTPVGVFGWGRHGCGIWLCCTHPSFADLNDGIDVDLHRFDEVLMQLSGVVDDVANELHHVSFAIFAGEHLLKGFAVEDGAALNGHLTAFRWRDLQGEQDGRDRARLVKDFFADAGEVVVDFGEVELLHEMIL